jgi:hypothetical protein
MELPENQIEKWEKIVNSVDKEIIPVEVIRKVIFKLTNGKQKTINMERLRKRGANIDELYEILDTFVADNDVNIKNMDFVLDIPAIAEMLQEESDEILKNI